MFRTVSLAITSSFSLYTQQYIQDCWHRARRIQDGRSWSYSQAVCKSLWYIPLLCVQWKISDDGERNCPKHVEFYSKNKFEKLVHLVGFIVRILSVCKPLWHTPLLCVQWKIPDYGQRNCPKHVEFYSKNKFEKLVHLVAFTIRIYHDARSSERRSIKCFIKISNIFT